MSDHTQEAARREHAVRLLRLRKQTDRLFDAYTDEAIGNPEVAGLAVFDGKCHLAWQAAWRRYSDDYHAYLDTYTATPPATLFDIYPWTYESRRSMY